MANNAINFLKEKMEKEQFEKIEKLNNEHLYTVLEEYIKLINPKTIFVCDDSQEDSDYIRNYAIESNEEKKLDLSNQTIHFDGINDQARDKAHTCFLTDKPIDPNLNCIDRTEGLKEIKDILNNIMTDKKLLIRFFCLGPVNSEFSIPCVQLTDSPYVAHSEILLYRAGYNEFKNLSENRKNRFFSFVHSEGELENNVCKNIDKRRIYINLKENIVYSTNAQYGGNTLGLKKLAMRLAINLAAQEENWLTEHMFLMGVNGPDNRKTYFTGAFPSMCGKTSTSMIKGESIVGDDIAYLRKKGDFCYGVNVERGMFGILEGVNAKDDPGLFNAIHQNNEIIFSNILIGNDNKPYWNDCGKELPESGVNFAGEWKKGQTPISHKNSRVTLKLEYLDNVDEKLDDPEGCKVRGIIYGGRDSDTSVPVEESFNAVHGIITKGASIESETTAATLGQEGVRRFNPMSNLDFLSIPLAQYIDNNLDFFSSISKENIKIFGVNYFLKNKENGEFLNYKTDKYVWLKWMELRVHNEVKAIELPTGKIPYYEDLQKLFKQVLDLDYTKDNYNKQFILRVKENLAKIERISKIYSEVKNISSVVKEELEKQKQRLLNAQKKYGDYILPEKFI